MDDKFSSLKDLGLSLEKDLHMFPQEIVKIMSLMHFVEKLKFNTRFGKYSNGQQETIGSHCWRLALLVVLCSKHFQNESFDVEKAITMALIHDIVEAEAGDHHFLQLEDQSRAEEIYKQEKAAITNIKDFLNNVIGVNLYDCWMEFESQSTFEARVVKALDKIEGFIQQNEAPLSTWTHEESVSVFYYLDQYCDFHPFLKKFKQAVIEEAKNKLTKENINVESLIDEARMLNPR